MTVKIIGAGMAGLLAANKLSHRRPLVIEAQKELPNNHSAVLRFRSPIVGDTLNIPFKKVTLMKDVLPWYNPVADALAYSKKCTGTMRSDRSIKYGLVVDDRYIAPPDLIQQMVERGTHDLKFGEPFDFVQHRSNAALPNGREDFIISTIPMPMLMEALQYPLKPEFKSTQGLNIRAKLKGCDAYASMLVPDPDKPYSRASITGDELIVEVPRFNSQGFNTPAAMQLMKEIGKQNLFDAIQCCFGIDVGDVIEETTQVSLQRYAKILPIDEQVRKQFMFWATDQFNIFSLGRYATWRPGLLLDGLVQDVQLIDRWIGTKDRYAVARHR